MKTNQPLPPPRQIVRVDAGSELSDEYGDYTHVNKDLVAKFPNLMDAELVAICLSGRNEVDVDDVLKSTCDAMRDLDGSLVELSRRGDVADVFERAGASVDGIYALLAALELSKRIARAKANEMSSLESPADVCRYVSRYTQGENVEKFFVLPIDNQLHLLAHGEDTIITKGTSNTCSVSTKEIFRIAIKYDASGFFLAHNHPSGNTHPSGEDKELTKSIHKLSKELGITFIDHIVVGSEKNYYSFRKGGELVGL